MRIEFTGDYNTEYKDIVENTPELKEEIRQRVHWFRNNPDDTRLDNHLLTKRMTGKWSFSVTNDIRIVYERLGKTSVRFLAIGRYKTVYLQN